MCVWGEGETLCVRAISTHTTGLFLMPTLHAAQPDLSQAFSFILPAAALQRASVVEQTNSADKQYITWRVVLLFANGQPFAVYPLEPRGPRRLTFPVMHHNAVKGTIPHSDISPALLDRPHRTRAP